ncbi:MAG TPA: RNA polymerase factor sigma-54, partial [Candidatus Hydrogenedentes bacterium]|nr:RNA polymerase factor sigma-54 [Candidatus Hydrogenedentota bacterium]
QGDVAEVAAELDIPAPDVERLLCLIKTFEPAGVGAQNLRECLLLQIEAEHAADAELRELVRDHFDLLKDRRVPAIARAMRITEAEVEEVMARLRKLEPRPGRAFASGGAQVVVPEVIIREVPEERQLRDGPRFEAVLADRLFQVRFDEEALTQYRETVRAKEGAAWVQERVREANDLLSNLTRREQTLLSVAQCIAETQEEFLLRGEEGLKPLRMADVAARVGIHESTVSRTVNGKYVQTPQGVLELKRFFSVGLATDDGEDLSARAVRAQIRALIEKEDKSAPLSDEALSDILQRDHGIRVARRTVAKYREGMGIPTKRERKRFS